MLACLLVWAAPAAAQLSRLGGSKALVSAPMRGSDSAFDPAHNVYLVVGAYGGVWGIFVNGSGDAVTAPFLINNAGGGFGHYVRVAYSPHVSNGVGATGGFLVTWHENVGAPNYVHTRIVAYPNRLVSPVRAISSSATWWESGASIAYSHASQRFLVTWRSSDYVIWGALIGIDGNQIGPLIQVSGGSGSRDPSVAWNPHTNEFGVVYTGFGGGGTNTEFARVAASGQVIRRNRFNFAASGTYITDLAFNTATGRFLAIWSQGSTLGAEIDANGDVVAQGLVSTVTGKYDGMGLSYNPVSGTFLLVGHGSTGNVWAAELNGRGARTSVDAEITSAGVASFYPRAGARTNGSADWDISFAGPGLTLFNQAVRTSSNGGGPAGSLGGAPPPSGGGGSTSGCPGTQPFPGAVCVNGGWVPGDGSSGGSTGGCPGTQPFPGAVCVNGGWVPGTTSSGGGGSTGGCPGTQPFPGAVCVNGGWVPGTTSSGGGGSTGGCPGTQPFPGAVCVNGGWVPGGTSSGGGGSTGGCPGTQPFPGAVCVNGGWIPGGSTGGSTSTGGCPGTQPFAGAVCVNGGWVPGGSTTSPSGGCTTPDPFVAIGGGTCVNGGWIPGTSSSGGCTTPDPFVAIGGGICSNGGWTPRP